MIRRAAGFLEALEVLLRAGVGALQAALGLPEAVEHGELGLGSGFVGEDIDLAYFHAVQFPLRDGHLLDVKLLGAGLGLPFSFEVVAKLVELLGVLARQHNGAGAKAVFEGVHANSSFTLGGPGTC